jgi:hypothetical protein
MAPVHASLLAALLQAAWVTLAPTADDQCPSSAQVQAALEAHAPKVVASSSDAPSGGPLTLSLGTSSGTVSLSLADRAGQLKLYRVLPPPQAGRALDCAALADTVALIVDRYFDEVELPAMPEKKVVPPPPPPPPSPPPPSPPPTPPLKKVRVSGSDTPSFALSGTVGRRFPGGVGSLSQYTYKLTVGLALSKVGHQGGALWLDASAGSLGVVSKAWNYSDGFGNATAVLSGADLALLLAWPVWLGRVYIGPQGTVDMVSLDAVVNNDKNQHETHFGVSAGLHLGYQVFGWQHFFARLDLNGCAAIVRQRVVTHSQENTVLFEAPAAYISVAGGVGVSF